MTQNDYRWCAIASPRDLADSRALWEEIFPEDSAGFLNYYDLWKMRDNRMETRRRSGQLISMIHWNPYRVHLDGVTVPGYYVIAVATRPEYRRRGLMAGQLRDGLNRFQQEGVPFLFLMPADPAIYEPFDFRYVYSRSTIAIEDEVPERVEKVEIRPLTVEEYREAAAFMEQMLTPEYPVHTVRDREYVLRTAMECRSEGGDMEGVFLEGRLAGCLSWWGDDTVEVRELLLIPELRDCAPGILRSRFMEAKKVTAVLGWKTGDAGDPIIMARIADLASFVRNIRSDIEKDIVIFVEDKLIPANHGLFRWHMGAEGSTLERIEPEEQAEPHIRTTIAELTGRLAGECIFTEIV